MAINGTQWPTEQLWGRGREGERGLWKKREEAVPAEGRQTWETSDESEEGCMALTSAISLARVRLALGGNRSSLRSRPMAIKWQSNGNRMAIKWQSNGNQWQSMAINGNQWQSLVPPQSAITLRRPTQLKARERIT